MWTIPKTGQIDLLSYASRSSLPFANTRSKTRDIGIKIFNLLNNTIEDGTSSELNKIYS